MLHACVILDGGGVSKQVDFFVQHPFVRRLLLLHTLLLLPLHPHDYFSARALTSTLLLQLLGPLCRPPRLLLLLLALAALVEVLDDDAHEHVEHEEADEEQERDEVEETPFIVVLNGLK